MINKFYNIYIDIDSILDLRLGMLEGLGVRDLIKEEEWKNRASDSVFGISSFYIYSLIENELDALFRYSKLNDIKDVIQRAFLDGCDKGLKDSEDITINLYIDLKKIKLDEVSLKLFRDTFTILIPNTINIYTVNSLNIDEYDSLIIYDSRKLLEYIVIMDKDYTDKKLYTPFLLDRLVKRVNIKETIEKMIEVYSPFIDLDFPATYHFSKKIKE